MVQKKIDYINILNEFYDNLKKSICALIYGFNPENEYNIRYYKLFCSVLTRFWARCRCVMWGTNDNSARKLYLVFLVWYLVSTSINSSHVQGVTYIDLLVHVYRENLKISVRKKLQYLDIWCAASFSKPLKIDQNISPLLMLATPQKSLDYT